jgi:hypothetical protein
MYSLKEILDLFHLSYTISEEDLKRAKKQVLMTHPDKSRLDAKYFLFYKKAFEVVVKFYDNQQKQHQEVRNTEYQVDSLYQNDKSVSKQVKSTLNNMDQKSFQKQFHTLFEKNMVKTVDPTRNEWFSSEESSYNVPSNVNKSNMADAFQNIRQHQNSVVRYNGIQTLHSSTCADNLYEDEQEGYVESDPFSKLKFDDLRKVHKDQTILSVSERDYDSMPKYNSMDQYVRTRDGQSITPLEKQEAEAYLAQQDKHYKERMMQKEYQAMLATKKYEEKNKSVLANFLRIT